MKHPRLATFLTLLILLAAGCAEMTEPAPAQEIVPGPTETAPTVTLSPTPNRYETLSAANDLTATIRALTPTLPTPTLTAIPTITPTEDIFVYRTAAPAPPAKCPQYKEGDPPTPGFYDPEKFWVDADEVIDYLNSYGPEQLISYYRQKVDRAWAWSLMEYIDYTNDGVRELVFGWGSFYIFGCQDGKYELLYQLGMDAHLNHSKIVQTIDANHNGIPEISILVGFLSMGGHNYQVIEWSGSQFNILLNDVWVEALGDFGSKDIDQNGFPEYVASIGTPVEFDSFHFGVPWRKQEIFFRWNGEEYVEYRRVFSPPEYRFQAVQDGDRALFYAEIDQALNFYRQVIDSEQLEWWSDEREKFILDTYWASQPGVTNIPTPTLPTPDPTEYDNLAAYARFKLMVAYAEQGWHTDAKIMFDNIQRRYPEDKVGHPYAELASIFWNEYEPSWSIAAGCQAANDFASSHEKEILYYIQGAGRYASNRINYEDEPWYICPFGR